MQNYEIMFILQPEMESEEMESLLESIKGVIGKQGGEIKNLDDWGKRRLAYEIAKYNEGHYFVITFKGSHKIIPEMEHFFRVNDEVIRYMIVREE